MALGSGEGTRLTLFKYTGSRKLKCTEKIYTGQKQSPVCIQDEDGYLSFLSPLSALYTERLLSNILRFQWEDQLDDEARTSFVTITKENDIYGYDMTVGVNQAGEPYHVLNHVTQCQCQTLKTVLLELCIEVHEQSSISILQYRNSAITILIDQTHLLHLLLYKDRPPDVTTVCSLTDDTLPLQWETVVNMEMEGDWLVIMDELGLIAFYSVINGSQMAVVDTRTVLSLHKPVHFAVTKDLKTLNVVDTENKLAVISLSAYFNVNPHHLRSNGQVHTIPPLTGQLSEVDEDQVDLSGTTHKMDTATYGDPLWKHSLGSLHSALQPMLSDSSAGARWQKTSSSSSPPSSSFPFHFTSTRTESSKIWDSKNVVTGLGVESRSFNQTGEDCSSREVYWSDVVHVLSVPVCCEGMTIKDMAAGLDSLAVWWMGDTHGFLCTFDLQRDSCSKHRLESGTAVLLSKYLSSPHFLLSETTLSAVAFNCQQEELVNKLMLYENATVADTLCRLNSWDRCSIPIHALEVGLKHRQLDTVAFFLKSRENLFTSKPVIKGVGRVGQFKPTTPQSPTGILSPVAGTMTQPFFAHHVPSDLVQVEGAIQLLIATVKETMKDTGSVQFAEQLLHLTLDYLHGLVKNALLALNDLLLNQGGDSEAYQERLELEGSIEKLTDYISESRQLMVDAPRVTQRQAGVRVGPVVYREDQEPVAMDEKMEGYTLRWMHMNTEEVILDGITQNCMPLVQAYLKPLGEDVSLGRILQVGLNDTIQQLWARKFPVACHLLQNMGFDVFSKLRQICFFTPHRELREHLISELLVAQQWRREERNTINYLHQVETLYTCQSFEKSCLLKKDGGGSCMEDPLSLQSSYESHPELLSHCGDLVPLEDKNSETSHYAHLLLDWVHTWDTSTRERILLDVLLYSSGRDPTNIPISSQTLFDYLTSHNDYARLLHWVQSSFPTEGEEVKIMWPYKKPLTVDLIQNSTYCIPYLKERLLDEIARRGVFIPSELQDFSQLLKRLGRIHQSVSKNNPCFLQTKSGYNQLTFHKKMIHFLTEEYMPQVLYYYLDYFRLGLDQESLDKLGLTTAKQTWVAMLVQFRLLAHNYTDPSQVFSASLSCARHILHLSTVTVEDMLEAGHIVWAMGMLLTSPHSINQVLSGSVQDDRLGRIDPQRLREQLAVYPKLQAALFPMGAEDSVPQQDITVYQLLQGTTHFDPSKSFLWQTTNNVKAADEETELPHFSLPSLTSKYSYKGQLGFTYYLKHGRPTFAFHAFITGEIQDGATVIMPRRQQMAYQRAHVLAIQQFNNTVVAAACVAFAEMIGKDSTAIRIHLQVAKTLYTYKTSGVSSSLYQRKAAGVCTEKEISSLLLPCVYHRRKSAMQVLSLLEEAVAWKIDHDKLKKTSLDASKEWLIVILFCHVQKLKLTTTYLLECAKDDHWVRFLNFAQLYQYPKELLVEVVSSFRSSHLREHLRHVVETVQVDRVKTEEDSGVGGGSKRQAQSNRSRDSRATLYSALGISNKEKESSSSDEEAGEETSSPKPTVASAQQHQEEAAPEEMQEALLNPDVLPEDVFGVLFACQAQPCPWKAMIAHSVALKNPVLALLAACIQGASTLDCLCAWLLTSLDVETCGEALSAMDYSNNSLFKMEDLSLLLHFYLQKNWVSMAATGFYIFQPQSPLVPFLSFYGNFMENKRFEKSSLMLEEFKELMLKYRRRSPRTQYPPDLIGDILWVEEQASSMVNFALRNMASAHDLLQFLRIVDQSAVTRAFGCEVPDVNKLCRLYNILYNADIQVEFDCLIRNDTRYCEDIVNKLQEKQLYNEARIFAEISGVAKDEITIKQLQVELAKLQQSSVWQSEQGRVAFWNHCDELMKKYQIDVDKAAAFFKGQVEYAAGHWEQAVLCQRALWWLQNNRLEHQLTIDRLQHIYWKCRVQVQLQNMEEKDENGIVIPSFDIVMAPHRSQEAVLQQTKKELLGFGKMPRSEPTKMADLSAKEIVALEALVGTLLDSGQISEASRLASQFGYFSQDLAIVVTCMRLAHGNIASDDIDESMKELLNKETPKRKSTLLSRPGSGTSFASLDPVSVEMKGILATMEKLQQHCNHGQQCCQMILTAYRISQMISKYNYERVMEEPHFTLLHSLLTCENEERFTLAKTYIETSGLADSELCVFLADQILYSLRVLTGASSDDESSIPRSGSELIVKPSSSTTVFPSLIDLCGDPSLLGSCLLDAAKALGSDTDLSSKELALEVELLVRAHHCFTKACKMEGIANILRSARVLSERLAKAEEFTLMLRLLTGVGRFSEMTYVFDILWQHHQFELLFRKGMEKAVGFAIKEDKLRLAILEYLKRYHPTDNDTYTMVSLHFTMYREIAQMLEERARKQLKQWISKHLDNSPDNENKLKEIIQLYSDAAESYLKEDCLRHAQSCVKQAQLVALQMHLLSSGTKVINLHTEDVTKFITTHNKFYESYIVAEAYNCKNIWPSALFQHVIINGDLKYLQDYKAHIGLNTAVILEVADRYRREGSKNGSSASNMKRLLESCKDIVTKFKVAQEFAFDDMWKGLLKGDSGPYLQDVMGSR
ncbi:spatacsin isoform X2 [Lingula anatina]|uniref:Spatacsin isoform X2 n=1 Tax=Lingula anatina TaxID=7574 RepID=A0A1S3J6Y8_LINAN|nr:spatacsin isoform X2 [Lingula anatina]|eukprot:XP_013406016.1 spatacsin isoform X2 [Lingula anatina]